MGVVLEHDALVEVVYSSVERERAAEALAELATTFGAFSAHQFVFHTNGALVDIVHHGSTDESFQRYHDEFQDKDPRLALAASNMGRVLTDADAFPGSSYERSVLYNELLREWEVRYTLFVNAPVSKDLVSAQALMATPSRGPSTRETSRRSRGCCRTSGAPCASGRCWPRARTGQTICAGRSTRWPPRA